MYGNYQYENVSEALPNLLEDLLGRGKEVPSRAGLVHELTHIGITLHKPWQREVLVRHRFPSIAAQIFETMWVLAGNSNLNVLKEYLPRALDFSDDGETWRAGYGERLRRWEGEISHYEEKTVSTETDQLAYVVDTLRKDPLSRQAVMSIWDPTLDTQPGKDIPCNNWLSFSIREGKLDLHVAIRSNDVIWGWSGINAFEWSALQEIVAGILGYDIGGLHFSVTSFHLYEHHWEKAEKIVGAVADPYLNNEEYQDSPEFDLRELEPDVFRSIEGLDALFKSWFQIEEKIRNGDPSEKSVNSFPEPMLRSWLRVLQWWWTGDRNFLQPLEGTRLEAATRYSVKPPDRTVRVGQPGWYYDDLDEVPVTQRNFAGFTGPTIRTPSPFIEAAVKLHNEKHAAYGDSWKRRGEMLGIMANIARKVDRLGSSETSDETSADTAMDLMIYLAKYRVWLGEKLQMDHVEGNSDRTQPANQLLYEVDWDHQSFPLNENTGERETWLTEQFDKLEILVRMEDPQRPAQVQGMLKIAYRLARTLWEKANSAPTGLGQTHAERNAKRSWNPEATSGGRPHRCVHRTSGEGHPCDCEKARDHAKSGNCFLVVFQQ